MMTKRFVALLVMAVVSAVSLPSCTPEPTDNKPPLGSIPLQGAGATFPAPLYKSWIETSQTSHPEVLLSYEVIGSGEGTQRFLAGTVDFGASDAALSDEEIAMVDRGVQLVPVTAGSLVLAYNLPGLGGDLRLKRDVYVDIFLGKITQWNDPRMVATNPGLNLPSTDIAVVARSDSSGTTFAFTNHLSAISDVWRDRGPGAVRLADWPGGTMLAPGNEGVAGRIQQSIGAIGYVQYGIAQRAGLAMAWLENRAGQFIQPHGGSGLAALINTPMPENLRVFFPDPEGEDSYPIATYSWLLLYKNYDDASKRDALKRYVKWCLTEGQAFNESLGYLRLPPRVVTLALAAVDQL